MIKAVKLPRLRTEELQATSQELGDLSLETVTVLELEKSESVFIVGADQLEELRESDFLLSHFQAVQETKTENEP
tara:strand:- start:946 stop:1170 length:225 start_codon:yes stop_codon:yes gene_type:complete